VARSKEIELNNVKRFQSWSDGRVRVTNEDTRELKKAKKEGKFSEAMLDRREKLKSDKFCK
jgi:protein FRG1